MAVLRAKIGGVWTDIATAGPPGPTAVSTDAGNSVTLGADGLLYFNFPSTYDELAAAAAVTP